MKTASQTTLVHSAWLCLAALASGGFSGGSLQAGDPNAAADFTLGTHVVSPAPPRFGVNLRDPAQYNNFTNDPGFEAITIKRQHIATSGGTDYIENLYLNGPTYSPGTWHYQTLADGFFDGAHVRVYRPSATGGALTFVREANVTNYITNGWRRLTTLPVSVSQFTDTTATPGVTYEYQVRVVNTSHVVSANHSTSEAVVTAAALAGSASATNPLFASSFFGLTQTAPAVPTGVTATAQAGAVFLDWNNNVETNLAGYYIYRRPLGIAQWRILLDSTGPAVQAGDIYFLEMTADNAPSERIHDRLGGYALNDTWALRGGLNFPYGLPGTMDRDSSTVPPENGGRTSLRLANPGTHELSVRQPRFSAPQFFNGFYPNLQPGRTYRVDAWLKQSGVPGGSVRFAMTQHYNSITHTWTVGADWQKYTFTFTAPALPTAVSLAKVMIAFNGPGTVWMDNVVLYEDADSDPATNPAFSLNAAPAQALVDYKPSVLRIWTGVDTEFWGVSLEDWTNPEPIIQQHWAGDAGRSIPDDPYKLPTALKICRDTGADPWLIVGSFFTEAECQGLIEYLAAPYDPLVDSPATKPWAAKRYAQGQTAPWTDVFSTIHFEYGNELWNGTYQWTFVDGNLAGQFSEYFFGETKLSPYFAAVAGKLRFVVNGWDISTNQTTGYGHAAALAAPSAHFADLANYIGGWEAGISVGGSGISDAGYQDYMLFSPSYTRYYANQQIASRDANTAAGHPYNLSVYEAGPGYANPQPGAVFDPVSEAYGKSLAAAVATLDTFLYNSLRRIDPQCYFSFAPGPNWSTHSTYATGFNPHATWLALQMRNQHAAGDMVSVATHSTPTIDVAQRNNSPGGAAAPNTPLLAIYPFRDGANYRVFVLSRKLTGDTPVTLRLPFSTTSGGTIYKLTGDPRATNSNALTITETQQTIGAFAQNFTFTMPAGSVFLLEFLGTNIAAPTNPGVTISRAIGQADPTTTPGAQFAIDFSEPVNGFTAADLQLSGTAGAGMVTLAQGSPFLGTNYLATVEGVQSAGTIVLNLPAGAAAAVDDGAASLAATIIDNSVDFAFPPPRAVAFASDDLSPTPAQAPNGSFLQAAASGSGFSQPWQVQNWNAATYTDGYKLGSSAPLTFSNLRTTVQYGIGGLGYQIAGRALEVSAFSPYGVTGSSPAVVGQSGTMLWFSVLLRKETNDDAPVRLDLVNADYLAAFPRTDLGVGYYGNNSNSGARRYWTLAVLRNNTDPNNPVISYLRSNVELVVGEAALLVVKMTFGTTDRFDLFVNPMSLAGAAPATPNATYTTLAGEENIVFRTARFRAGLGFNFSNDGTNNGLNKGSLDEIRFGDTFAAATPTNVAANVAPSFTKGPDQTVAEDSGAQTIAGWTTNIDPGGAAEAAQAVDFLVSHDNPGLFAAAPAVAPNGTLTFTPATNANGTATVSVRIHDDGGTANGGLETSAPQTFIISVSAMNDAPLFVKGGNQTVGEDAGPQNIAWATAITPGAANETEQALTFLVSSDNAALFAAAPAISADGTLSFTPAANANGRATLTVQLQDNGGTAGGGTDLSGMQTFTIDVLAVNDPPTFTKGADQESVIPGAHSVAGWATNVSAGPANEAVQTLDFIVSNSNETLFAVPPAISAAGTLMFTLANGASGLATVSARLHDSGGTSNGGIDTSAAQTFVIRTQLINDPPSFTAGADQAAAQDAGPQTVSGWAANLSPGPADESAEALNFIVEIDGAVLFSTLPAIAPDGTLIYTPAPEASGKATITVRLHDDGGTADGGIDTSAAQTFTIAITTFAEETGTYNGLVQPGAGGPVTSERFGVAKVTLGKKGAFTGSLRIAGKALSFSGSFDKAGAARFGKTLAPGLALKRKGQPDLALALQLEVANGSDKITGTLRENGATFAAIEADRALYSAAKVPVPPLRKVPQELLGKYTVVFAAKTPAEQARPASEFPQGDGVGVLTVKPNGTATLTGTLADGTAVNCANALSKTNAWPFHVSLAGGKSSLTGPALFRAVDEVSDLDAANLHWFKPAFAAAKLYPAGWPTGLLTDLLGSKYVVPEKTDANSVMPGLGTAPDGNAEVAWSGGNAAPGALPPKAVTISASNKVQVIAPAADELALTISSATGNISGRFIHPENQRRTTLKAVIFQKQQIGLGFFLGPSESGSVSLTTKE